MLDIDRGGDESEASLSLTDCQRMPRFARQAAITALMSPNLSSEKIPFS